MSVLHKTEKGFTLIELLVVVTILGILSVSSAISIPSVYRRARDSHRKDNLQKMKIAVENYAGDEQCYPPAALLATCNGTGLNPYLPKILCDPLTKQVYRYLVSSDCLSYEIYAVLENDSDPIIEELGCESGCGPGNNYNYGVSGGRDPWGNK